MYRVLVIEDDLSMRELLELYLRREGYEIITASTGVEGVEMALSEKPDLILLDIMLPGIDGWEVCRRIRNSFYVPIIMITAKGEEVDRILGLELGADDYITKPFSPRELMARIKAMFRRIEILTKPAPGEEKSRRLVYNGLEIDHELHCVILENEDELVLTPKEFDLLWVMAANSGKVFTREELLEQIWGYDYLGGGRTVDTLVKRLRKKLDQYGRNYIKTVWGVGYRFEDEG